MARAADRGGFAAAALLGAALSMVIVGFTYGASNNLFHLLVIGRMSDEPQFATDAFVQSMRFFAAGPFQLLQGSDRFIAPEHLFFGLACLSRLLAFAGLLACASLIGITSRRDRLVFTVLIACSQLLQEYSFAGNGGLFIAEFTHSEIDNGLSLLTIYYAARGRLTTAFALNGLVFFTNAFIGVWNAGPLLLIIALLLYQRRLTPRQVLVRGGAGFVLFLVLASPVIANVASNPDFGRAIDFDYKTFLLAYFPLHFLFGSIGFRDVVGLIAAFATGALAFFTLARRIDVFQAALWGYGIVYGIGIVIPSVTGNPAILNLHLLRSSTGIQLLAGLGSVALATRWLVSQDRHEARVFGPLLVVTLCSIHALLVLAPVVILAALPASVARLVPDRLLTGRKLQPIALAVMLLALWPATAWRHARENEALRTQVAEWEGVGAWARQNTPADATFLTPVSDPKLKVPPIEEGAAIFQYVAHRRVWVDDKRGAAVMWSPSYYAIWRRRMDEQIPLSSLNLKLDYAQQRGIGYVADDCALGDGTPAAFQAGQVCVFDVPPTSRGVRASTDG